MGKNVSSEIPKTIDYRGKRYRWYATSATESTAISIQRKLKDKYPDLLVHVAPIDTSAGRRRVVYVHE
jgi:hypothetical protein